jgi:hypothetical protein
VTGEIWLGLAGVLLVLLAAWTTWTLTRLRRLEKRVQRAWTMLDAQLRRRAGLAEELCRDHPAALGKDGAERLAAAAAQVRAPLDVDRELAENALGHGLRSLRPGGRDLPPALWTELAGTVTRVGLARRFYNDAVRDLRALRRTRLPRLLRLHAGRPLPRFFDIDDGLDEVRGATDRAGQRGR